MQISIETALAVLAGAFGIWAWIVGWGVSVIKREMENTRNAALRASESLENHILATERRLTMLETEFGFLRRYLSFKEDTRHES